MSQITPQEFVRGLIVGETIEVPYYGEMQISGVAVDPRDKQKATVTTVAYNDNDNERNIVLWSSEARRKNAFKNDHPLEALMPTSTDHINCERCGGHGTIPERARGQQSGNGYETVRCPRCLGSGTLPPIEKKTTPQH